MVLHQDFTLWDHSLLGSQKWVSPMKNHSFTYTFSCSQSALPHNLSDAYTVRNYVCLFIAEMKNPSHPANCSMAAWPDTVILSQRRTHSSQNGLDFFTDWGGVIVFWSPRFLLGIHHSKGGLPGFYNWPRRENFKSQTYQNVVYSKQCLE